MSLDGDRLSTALGNFINDLVRALLRRGVVHYNSRAFRREMLGDAGSDSFRGSGYDRNLVYQFSIFHFVLLIFLSLVGFDSSTKGKGRLIAGEARETVRRPKVFMARFGRLEIELLYVRLYQVRQKQMRECRQLPGPDFFFI